MKEAKNLDTWAWVALAAFLRECIEAAATDLERQARQLRRLK